VLMLSGSLQASADSTNAEGEVQHSVEVVGVLADSVALPDWRCPPPPAHCPGPVCILPQKAGSFPRPVLPHVASGNCGPPTRGLVNKTAVGQTEGVW
jgi:hypothetical protein